MTKEPNDPLFVFVYFFPRVGKKPDGDANERGGGVDLDSQVFREYGCRAVDVFCSLILRSYSTVIFYVLIYMPKKFLTQNPNFIHISIHTLA